MSARTAPRGPVVPGPEAGRAAPPARRAGDMFGEPLIVEGAEILARCLQHETDHLDGILFVDRMDAATRKLAMKAVREAEWAGGTGTHSPAQPARDLRPGHVVRLVFAGISQVAVPSLDALTASSHQVVAVVTRPDAPAGRGRSPPSPVRARADALGLRVLTPVVGQGPRRSTTRCASWRPTRCPVVAYGALLPQRRARHPRARLGQPALLAAARLARCGAGAARGDGRGRRHRGDRRSASRRGSTPVRCSAR